MMFFEIDPPKKVTEFFKKNIRTDSLDIINSKIQALCGCVDFFASEDELRKVQSVFSNYSLNTVSEKRVEYGDYQTNEKLAETTIDKLLRKQSSSEYLIEPTCGKGHFILAAIKNIPTLKQVWGIEIYEPYVWECKFSILDFYLNNPNHNKPTIHIILGDVFEFDFNSIKQQISNGNLLIIGNPPWVTNSLLGTFNSTNLPAKSNFKKQKGLDAITGKGNFDIAEYITYSLIKTFDSITGYFAFLIKNSVIKNILFEQKKCQFHISDMEEHNFDAQKEFSVSVDASLFTCKLNSQIETECAICDFYSGAYKNAFGWHNDSFISNIELSVDNVKIEGTSPFVWRQGIKHDCAKVMELERIENGFSNKLGETFSLEDDLVYDILKSSDLKVPVVRKSKKCTIVTQKNIGQDTKYISHYPNTFVYLQSHKSFFEARKSSIYNGKPDFSIFGIGEYSFAPYKVAISGLYKTFHFTLVTPNDANKPIMLDDTCYFIGFEKVEDAAFVVALLNLPCVEQLLKSISFPDAKRMITKDVLMRIDLEKVLASCDVEQITKQSNELQKSLGFSPCDSTIPQQLSLKKSFQLTLF